MKYLLALDQGTTSSRAILFDRRARIVASDNYEFPQLFPKPGWVEHDPEAIWISQKKAMEGALSKAGCTWRDVAAIGITNQRETVVAWDGESGMPAGNAIVWQDRRTASLCEQLKGAGKEDWIQEQTGLLLDPYFSGTKMRWLLENSSEVKALADSGRLRFGTIDSWLIWKLTGGASHLTDVSNASRTLLMNLERCDWDDALLETFEIDRESLPSIGDSSGALAETDPKVTGGVSVPIAGVAGDQQAALFGQLCFDPGMVKCTYGTGCFILMQVGSQPARSQNKLLSTVAWRMNGKTEYALEGSVFMGGASVQWLRDQLGLIGSASEIEALARRVEDSEGVVMVPAFTGLGAPYWDPYARGMILGLTRGSGAAHIARATLDGIAYQVVDVARGMEQDSGRTLTALQADGGASANSLLMQIQADLIGATVNCPRILETTALGAAFLAGLAVGYWESKEALAALVEADRSYQPTTDQAERERRLRRWQRAVERCRGWEDEA